MDNKFEKILGTLLSNTQEKVESMQKELAQIRVSGSAGAGAVKVVVSGERKVLSVEINSEVMDDREMLQDLIAGAVTDALSKVETAINEKMQASLLGQMGNVF